MLSAPKLTRTTSSEDQVRTFDHQIDTCEPTEMQGHVLGAQTDKIPPQKKPPRTGRLCSSKCLGLAEGLFLDLCGLANLLAQVVQLSTTDIAPAGHLDLVDLRGVNREGTLNADAGADLANGEGFARGLAMTTDNVTLEHLDTLLVALGDAIVDSHGIANGELRDVLLDLLLLNSANDIQVSSFLYVHTYSYFCFGRD